MSLKYTTTTCLVPTGHFLTPFSALLCFRCHVFTLLLYIHLFVVYSSAVYYLPVPTQHMSLMRAGP